MNFEEIIIEDKNSEGALACPRWESLPLILEDNNLTPGVLLSQTSRIACAIDTLARDKIIKPSNSSKCW